MATMESCLAVAGLWAALLLVAALALVAGPAGAQEQTGEVTKKRRILYNSDGSNIFWPTDSNTPEAVHRYVDEVVGTQVDTFLICPCAGQPMYYPSQVSKMFECTDHPRELFVSMGRNLRDLVAAGHDPIGLVVDRAREQGLEVFITFRMNELHGANEPGHPLNAPFWEAHPEYRVGDYGGGLGGYGLNFALPAVREYTLALITECCGRYDIDGLELDWQRFPFHVPAGTGAENAHYLTDFTAMVRAMLDRLEAQRGREILLSARVLPTLEKSLAIGLDPVTWADQHLVDFLTVSRFLHNNEGTLDIKGHKNAIPDIPIYGCIELTNPVGYREEARRLWSAGVDGMYLFNFFCTRESGREPPFYLLNELGSPPLPSLGAYDTVPECE